MKATILTVGDEITSGHISESNSAYLASKLEELGIEVCRMVSVGDDVDIIACEIGMAAAASDVIMVTGGLGTTHDDVTKEAAARASNSALVVDAGLREALEVRFMKRGRVAPELVDALATIPRGARKLPNPVGGAVGFRIDISGAGVYFLPGVPIEMRSVFESAVAPDLEAYPDRTPAAVALLRTIGVRESQISGLLRAVQSKSDVRISSLPLAGGVDLRIAARGGTGPEVRVAEAAESLRAELGSAVYADDASELHQVVGKLLLSASRTVSVAESCTGGLIGHLFTQVPGISSVLDRVIVTYSNRSKIEELGVAPDMIDRSGAVSREVAGAMAEGVRRVAGTDLGISTTGIAGPSGGTETKPVGLVFIGLAGEARCDVRRHIFPGTREMIKARAALYAIDMVRLLLMEV
jgi:nicotinamide-nucleotide amidase